MMPGYQKQTRRRFLKTSALAGSSVALLPSFLTVSAATAVKISSVVVYPVNYPMIGRFKFFEGPRGHMQGRAAAIIKITADDGTVGWGESVPIPKWSYETLETVTTTIRHYLTPELIGHPVLDIAGAHRIMNSNIAPSFSTGQPMAKAGIDIALHDLAGKITGQSLAQLWQRDSIDKIKLSWTLNPKTLDDLDALLEDGLRKGYNNFNVKVAPEPEFDIAMCKRVRQLVPEGFLWADANGGYDPTTALLVAPRLADAGVDVLEQPLQSNRISAYRQLKKQGALPILLDEGVVSPATLLEFIRLDMLDGVAMKPARCGGLMSAKRQIEILRDAGLMVLGSGLTDPDISLAATLALYGAFAYDKPAALNGPQFIATSVLQTPLRPRDGSIAVPTGKGMGISVDENKIQDIQVKI
jgi:L-alanine-DL-glutamate epimerase-like enolase superfamily enzyme